MLWKNLPQWLKGGIIGGVLFIILLLVFLSIPPLGCNFNKPLPEGELYEDCVLTDLSDILFPPSYILLDIFEIHNDYLAFSFAFIFSLAIYFLVGAFIGKIIEKFVERGRELFAGKPKA
jgi:ABC-type antimicrobial peptide transport system permease subunit